MQRSSRRGTFPCLASARQTWGLAGLWLSHGHGWAGGELPAGAQPHLDAGWEGVAVARAVGPANVWYRLS